MRVVSNCWCWVVIMLTFATTSNLCFINLIANTSAEVRNVSFRCSNVYFIDMKLQINWIFFWLWHDVINNSMHYSLIFIAAHIPHPRHVFLVQSTDILWIVTFHPNYLKTISTLLHVNTMAGSPTCPRLAMLSCSAAPGCCRCSARLENWHFVEAVCNFMPSVGGAEEGNRQWCD